MSKPQKKKAPAALIVAGTAIFRALAARRHLLPKCGAMAKRTGQPCQRLAMANGRCHYHGGRTPKGKDWHKMQLPDKSSPNAWPKTEAKLRKARKDQKARERKLAAMSVEERVAHEEWHRDRPLGTPEYRQRKKLERQQNADARARYAKFAKDDFGTDPTNPANADQISCLRAKVRELEQSQPPEDDDNPDHGGIFG